jgi:hypothetical protein
MVPTAPRVAAAQATDCYFLTYFLPFWISALLFGLLLVASENQLGVDRQRVEQEVEPFAVLVRIARAQVQLVVVLVLALDDGVGAVCRFRHIGVL